MVYLSKEHEVRFYKLLKEDHTKAWDKERQSLLYILAGSVDLYQKKKRIYNTEKHRIIPCIASVGRETIDLSSGSKALVQLGFQLYNGSNEKDCNISNIFGPLDEEN